MNEEQFNFPVEKFECVESNEITFDYIQQKVEKYYWLPVGSIQTDTRKREIVQARQIAMFFAKQMIKASLATVGKNYGDKDHATCLHAIKTVNNLCETDKNFRKQITEIENQLKK